ncbi:MAG: TIGR03000 domain-containing protein, partial [Gemmataceae bacterium]|nr:TIGR03000 domain-containing protein [Gemmataceae bacterium]
AAGSSVPAGHWHGGHRCHGCYGGCYGCNGGCYGCYGGCYGGCHGCYGGCHGCYGGCYGCWGGYGTYSTCYGCHGGYGCYGCYGCAGYAPVQVQPTMPAAPATPETVPAPKAEEKKAAAANAAKLVVDLPADAQLFVDDQLMKTTSAHRVFSTPTLEPGQTYYYILRVEVVRDGKPQAETKRVIVRAGEVVRATFSERDAITTVKAESDR